MSYEQEFQIFSSNINLAARAFYYHAEVNRQVYADGLRHMKKRGKYFQSSKIYQAVNANARFWNDYRHSSLLTCIVALGRIFDTPCKAHKIKRLIKTAEESGLFRNEKLKERKVKGSDNASEWIDSFMSEAHELTSRDFKKLNNFVNETYKKWDTVKNVRHKIFVHQEVMDDLERTTILKTASYSVFEEIIKRLLTVERILWQAFYNGKKPDYTYSQNNTVSIAVQKNVCSLLTKLASLPAPKPKKKKK